MRCESKLVIQNSKLQTMKSKLLILGAIVLIFGCTTEPIIPPNFTGEDQNGNCVPGFISFEQEILPIVTSNCAMSGCHDEITAEDDVILTNYANIMKEVTPNDPMNSALYEYIILPPNDEDIMPPPPYSAMTQAQQQLIKDWINQGALETKCAPECDSTLTSTFAAVVYPIVETACVGCHNDNLAEGGIKLNSYDLVKASVDNGGFMGSIEHQVGWVVMPPSGIKLSDCQISLLNQWITNGALND